MYADPVRRYMLPVFSDRRTDWPSHPYATRDSLHEHDMWVAEGLTHRYPTKVLAELLPTCPQYCGHCTRMDLVGNDVPQVEKLKFHVPQKDRHGQILDYLRRSPSVRDVVVSGGDVANMPWPRLEDFLTRLLEIENIRDIRLATKALIGHGLGAAGVVEAVDNRAEVYVDGGVRRGVDVVKALAMGARAVLIGRPQLWGLTLGGEDGVVKMLAMLRAELELAMALCGADAVAKIDRALLAP